MPITDIPQNLSEYLHYRLAALHPNATLVLVFDTSARLAFGDIISTGGRTWRVVHYDGNDLAFRSAWLRQDARATNRLVWVTPRPTPELPDRPLDVTSLSDLIAKADDIIDMSMAGVIDALIPNQVWPAKLLEEYADLIGANLPAFVDGHSKLRTILGPRAAMDAAAIRMLALHCRQPSIPVDDLLFQRDDAAQLLRHYMRLAWRTGWDSTSRELLRKHVKASASIPLGDVEPWLDTPIEELARYLYIRRFLSRNRVPHIANQIRGVGILSFDPERLETWVDQVLTRWEREPDWRRHIVTSAEETLTAGDLARVAQLVTQPADGWGILGSVEGPGMFVQLAAAVLAKLLPQTQALHAALVDWSTSCPLVVNTLPTTQHTEAAAAVGGFLDEAGRVISTLAQGFHPGDELAGIIDWYVSGKFYDLEFAHDRAKEHVRKLATNYSGLAAGLADYLAEMRQQVRAFLRHADLELAARIRANWRGYLSNPRLAINVLSDLIKRQCLRPSRDECLWFVVFDGMRWDTWQYTVKPRLLEQFEFAKQEKPYLSMLPSWTMVARTSLLTGQPPQSWQQAPGRQSIDQAALAARAFGIQPNNVARELRFFSNTESDRKYEQLDPEDRYPWNVLIFNISDDNLHKEKGSLSALNRTVSSQMDSIMQTLALVVRPGDTLLVSSDHGFMELDEEDGIVIRNAERWQRQSAGGAHPVRYRYLLGIKSDEGYAFDLPGFPTTEFTAAVSQAWFRRSDDRRPPDRYAHGGLSLAEMVVPGATLQRIVEKKVEIVLADVPAEIVVREAEPIAFNITVRNHGNQPGQFRIDIRCSTETVSQSIVGSLTPGAASAFNVRLTPPTGVRTGSVTFVELLFTHQNLQGGWLPARRTDISLQIEQRTDVVEIQFAGLDDLDEP